MNQFCLFSSFRQTFSTLFHNIFQHFRNGDINSFVIPDLQFEQHPGPVSQALSDAKDQNKSLIIYIFSSDFSVEDQSISVFREQSVIDSIRDSYIFLPLSITSSEGLKAANFLSFTQVPLVAIVKPDGTSLESSRIYSTCQGTIDQSSLISIIAVERTNVVTPNQRQENEPFTNLIQEQNNEYERAEEEEILRMARHVEELVERENREQATLDERKRIEEQFESLPKCGVEGSLTVKFMFPGFPPKINQFPVNATLSQLYIFARKFMYPKEFFLDINVPQMTLQDANVLVSDVVESRQFVVIVHE